MVNVFVKSTKVPRPPVVVTMVPPDFIPPSTAIHGMKPNLKNQLKQQMKQAMNASRILLNDESVQQNQQHYFSYAGNANIPITSKLKIVLPGEDVPRGIWPAFRMMVRAVALHTCAFILVLSHFYIHIVSLLPLL